MKHLPWKYSAGLVDGEGCVRVGFRIKKNGDNSIHIFPQIGLELTLTESCKHVVDLLENNYGGRTYLREYDNPNWKPTWTWRLYDKSKCRAIFQNIHQYCLIKGNQMLLAMWCYDNLRGEVSREVMDTLKSEFKALKADPHRLSERATQKISELMR